MMTTPLQGNRRQQFTDIARTMSREDMAWAIKYLTDCMMVTNANNLAITEKRPSWWNRPLLDSTKALIPMMRQDLGDDYKEELTDILEEKYL